MRAFAGAAIVGLSMLLAPAAASARVSAGDATATGVYLRLQYAEKRSEVKDIPSGIAAIGQFAQRLTAQCSGVLANAPKPVLGVMPNSSQSDLAEEELEGAFGVAERLEATLRRKFSRAVARLRWSDAKLTQTAHTLAASEVAQAEMPTPDLCADAQAWVASGYQTVSAATTSYVARQLLLTKTVERDEAALGPRLERFENRADRQLAKRIASIDSSEVSRLLDKVLAAYRQVHEALNGPSVPFAG